MLEEKTKGLVTVLEAKSERLLKHSLSHMRAFAHSFSELGFETKLYSIYELQRLIDKGNIKRGSVSIPMNSTTPTIIYRKFKKIEWGDIAIISAAVRSLDFYRYIPDSVYKINYQPEQLLERGFFSNRHTRSEGYNLVLDLYNIHTKLTDAKNVVYFPGGYSPIYDISQGDLDMLDFYFVGGYTKRRHEMLVDIRKKLHDYRIEIVDGHGGKYCREDERNSKIKSSKINVYVKQRPDQYFCPNHMLMVVCKQKFYLHEKCNSGYGPYKPNKHFIEFEGVDDFVKKFKYWVSHDEEREAFAKNAYEDLKENHSMTKYLSEILKKYYRGYK